jgi:hypothetical protein
MEMLILAVLRENFNKFAKFVKMATVEMVNKPHLEKEISSAI